MISNDYKTKIAINKKEMANCIDRATLLIKEGDKKPVFLSMKETEMELSFNSMLRIAIRNLSNATTFNLFPFTSNNSPVSSLFFSASLIAKLVCLIISFNEN